MQGFTGPVMGQGALRGKRTHQQMSAACRKKLGGSIACSRFQSCCWPSAWWRSQHTAKEKWWHVAVCAMQGSPEVSATTRLCNAAMTSRLGCACGS